MLKANILTFLLPLLFLLNNPVPAQNESFLGLCLGAAIPQGVYAEKDYYKEGTGYANTGFLFSFDGAIFPDDYLGIGATVTYGSNNPDKTKYKEDFSADLMERYPNLDIEDLEERLYFDYGVWRYLNFHAGPAVTFAAGNFNFDLNVLAGLSLAWAPQQEFQLKLTEEETFSRKVEDKAIPTLGFTFGGGVRYALKKGYVLRVMASYTNCKPTMEISELQPADGEDVPEIITREVQMPIKNIHLGIGIAYNFEI
jgi:opacity protein-like surface antigen